MKKAILIISIFFLFSSLSFAQLTIVNTGTNAILNQISIIGNNIVVNGRNDYMAKCYDECDTLIPLTVAGPVGYNNYDLNRLDTNNFFILPTSSGSNYSVYKSSDGGSNWQLKFDTAGVFLTHLAFFDTLEGVAIGTQYRLIRTQDGGNTWTNESAPLIITSAAEVFGDSTICVGTNERFRISHDRGKTWTGTGFIQASPRDFFFLNKDTLFATSYSGTGAYFSYSFNGGATWQHNSLQNGIEPYGIYFKSDGEGYVVGRDQVNNNYGIILKTTDWGQSWSLFDTQITTLLTDIKFLNDSIALIAGTGGVLLKWNSKTFSTNISETLTPYFNVTINPNPTTDKITISSSGTLGLIEICNIFGKIIYQSIINNSQSEIDISTYSDGVYFLFANNNGQVHTIKIIKM